jgi:hypothetical protein
MSLQAHTDQTAAAPARPPTFGGGFPAERDAYVARFGSERFFRLLRRKILGRLGRRLFSAALRRRCLRWMGVRVEVSPGEAPPWVGLEVYIDDSFPELVSLGAGAVLGVRCMLLCHDDALRTVAPVAIGRRAYIGAGAIVLPGVTIGDGAIVGAGAVVTKSVPPGETWGGVPARSIASGRAERETLAAAERA